MGGRAPLTERWQAINRTRSRVRAFCEHPFLVVKRHWGFDKVRYRGLAKNAARAYTMFALANLLSGALQTHATGGDVCPVT